MCNSNILLRHLIRIVGAIIVRNNVLIYMECTEAGGKIMDENELKEVIISSVKEAWDNEQPVLLSDLGGLKNGVVGETAKSISGRLGAFILTKLSDDIILIKHSTIQPLIGAIPKNEQTSVIENFDAYLEKKKISSVTSRSGPRLVPSFWAAFRKLLASDYRRFINVDGRVNFINQPVTDLAPVGMLEINREYIAQNDSESDREVFQKVEKWCTINDLSLSKFEKKASDLSPKSVAEKAQESSSLLERIVHALNEDDLRRIHITMDIVKKLSIERS